MLKTGAVTSSYIYTIIIPFVGHLC